VQLRIKFGHLFFATYIFSILTWRATSALIAYIDVNPTTMWSRDNNCVVSLSTLTIEREVAVCKNMHLHFRFLPKRGVMEHMYTWSSLFYLQIMYYIRKWNNPKVFKLIFLIFVNKLCLILMFVSISPHWKKLKKWIL
jgi:hypothetical protein